MKYFAYGSNMDIAQMAVRCHKATLLGSGLLAGYRFRIDGRGFATVDKEPSASVLGLVWELTPEDEANLDRFEGVPRFYTRETFEVRHDERLVPMLIYVSTDRLKGKPAPNYLERIVQAAQEQGFGKSYVDQLTSWSKLIPA